MSAWPSWETARLAWEGIRFWLIIIVGSFVGLLGAFGREQHEGRKPDRKWLTGRLCIMPFLAMAAAALGEIMNLSGQVMAFAAAIFSLLAYDLVRVIAMRTLKKAAGGDVEVPSVDFPRDAAIEIPSSPDGATVLKVKTTPGATMRAELRNAMPLVPADPDLNQLLEQLPDDAGNTAA